MSNSEQNKSHQPNLSRILSWFASRREANPSLVKQIPFDQLNEWYFEKESQNLVHASGKFFKIRGIRVSANFGPIPCWDQPIIDQNEIGILGIITKKFNGTRYFLMQAKMEPGNVNVVQLSPTVQATKSNYTQTHKGKKPQYLEFFLNKTKSKILVNRLQPEQGGRFLQKQNRNIVIEVEEDFPVTDDFHWMTLYEIKKLLQIDNFVNMDARSVLACIPSIEDGLSGEQNGACHSQGEIINWFHEMKARYEFKAEEISLKDVSQWTRTEKEIKHMSGGFFSIIAVSVQAGNREVSHWTQPLIRHPSYGLVGFLTKKINGLLHFLVQARLEAGGITSVTLTTTVGCVDALAKKRQGIETPFLDFFMKATPSQIKYNCLQSDEGGRFFHSQNRCMVVLLDPSISLKIPENYCWMTLGQMMELIKHGYFNMDARGLIACLNFI